MIFKHNFDIGLGDINSKRELKNKKIFECLENAAAKHGDSIGLGLIDINKTGLTWMILDWKLKIIKRPHYGDIVEVHTWSRNSNKCYAYRDYEIYVNGEKYAIATSKWLLIDINKAKPARIEEDYISQYKPEPEKMVFEQAELEKLQEQEEYTREQKYDVRKCDIDINGHMHNLNYLDIVYEILTDDECQKEFTDIRITYKKEIKFGDKIKCLCHKSDEKYYFVIKSNDDKNIHAIIEMCHEPNGNWRNKNERIYTQS